MWQCVQEFTQSRIKLSIGYFLHPFHFGAQFYVPVKAPKHAAKEGGQLVFVMLCVMLSVHFLMCPVSVVEGGDPARSPPFLLGNFHHLNSSMRIRTCSPIVFGGYDPIYQPII